MAKLVYNKFNKTVFNFFSSSYVQESNNFCAYCSKKRYNFFFSRLLRTGPFQLNSESELTGSEKHPQNESDEHGKRSDYEMSAWKIHINNKGGENSLKLDSNARIPVVRGSNDVLVKVKSFSLNPLDLYMRDGYGSVMFNFWRQVEAGVWWRGEPQPTASLILGRDFAGEVRDVGNTATSFRVGDQVYGVVSPHRQGCFAEYVIADKDMVCKIPEHSSHTEAASVLYAGLTAWSALKLTGDLCLMDPKRMKALVIGGSGGVGSYAVQLLKNWGSTVVSTCNSDAVPLVKELGADTVIDYTSDRFKAALKESSPFDIVLDASGVARHEDYLPLLKTWTNAKFITLRAPMLKNTENHGLLGGMLLNAVDLAQSNITSGALTSGRTVRWAFFIPVRRGVEEISNLYEQKKIRPIVHQVFKFSQFLEAFDKLKNGHLRGKVVVDID